MIKRQGIRWGLSIVAVMAIAVTTAPTALAGPGRNLPVSAAHQTAATPAAVPAADPDLVTADSLPTAQIDGVVWSQSVVGNTVFAGGRFANARPAGAAAGTSLMPRTNLMSYDITTGKATNWAPYVNSQVTATALSPDKQVLYIGGDFTNAGGQSHTKIAAFSVATGAVIGSFSPSLNGRVRAIAVSATAVYVGGSFTTANGVARLDLAAFSPVNGALLGWAPAVADQYVSALVLNPAGTKLIVGGSFTKLNGAPNTGGIGALDPVTGATVSWAVGATFNNSGANSGIYSLSTDGQQVFGSAWDFQAIRPFFEGVFALNPNTGVINWLQDCHGDTYSVYSTGNTVYSVSHAHNCQNIGGFSDNTGTQTWHRALAVTAQPTGTVYPNYGGIYTDFSGQPSPSLKSWFPDFQAGTFTGQNQAGWSITGNDSYVAIGGEFPLVNGTAQQGLSRFALRPLAPKKSGPYLTGSHLKPNLIANAAGVIVSIPADWDKDDASLTYDVIRNGDTANPIYTTTMSSTFWNLPVGNFVDTTVRPSTTYSYRIFARDGDGNLMMGDSNSITTPAVIGGVPPNPTNPALNSPTSQSSLYAATPSPQPGLAADGNTNGDFTQVSGSQTGTDLFSWWQVDLKSIVPVNGVTIFNRTDCCTDRLTDYWVFASASPFDTRLTPTQQAAQTGVWSSHRTSGPFSTATIAVPAGTTARYVMIQQNTRNQYLHLAEVQVASTAVLNTPPTANFTSSTAGATASFNGSGSVDPDGSIASYAWTFGDGASGTGVTTSHVYATSGTYNVTLTVTDNQGATGSVTKPVTIAIAGPTASDTFSRTLTGSWGTSDSGANWSVTGASGSASVSGGFGLMSVAPGATTNATLAIAARSDTNAVVDLGQTSAPAGGGTYVTLAARRVGTSEYQARVRLVPGGVTLTLAKQVGGAAATLQTATIAGLTYSAGSFLRLRLNIAGTAGSVTLSGTVWKVGAAEPAAQLTATDGAPLAAGVVGLTGYLSSSGTAATTVRFDNLSVS